MAAQTGSTYFSQSVTDVVKILTANLWITTMASSKKVSLGDHNNDRQPEMASETGNTYVFETMKYSIEIPTSNLTFTT